MAKQINFNELCEALTAEVAKLPKSLEASTAIEVSNLTLFCGILCGKLEMLNFLWQVTSPIDIPVEHNPKYIEFSGALIGYMRDSLNPAVDKLTGASE